MRSGRRAVVLSALAGIVVVVEASPAAAHAFGGRSDLPLPFWMFAYGAAAALVASFAALAVFWPAARLEGGVATVAVGSASGGAAAGLAVLARVLGVVLFAVVLGAAAFGSPDTARNIAPVFVYVVFWVGLTLVSALVGDVWRVLSPFDTLAWLGQRLTGSRGRSSGRHDLGYWPAVVLLFGFVWLELVYPDRARPRVLAVAIALYTVVVLAGALRWGRGWLREGEAFAALFGVVSHMAPVYAENGRLRLRPPLAGLASLQPQRGLDALVLVALGSTSFDGLSRTRFWQELTTDLGRWSLTVVATMGLVWTIAMVALIYRAAMAITARLHDRDAGELGRAFVHSLVPIAVAYAVAHYFSLLVFEGQTAVALASDPFGRGWDLLGTAGRTVDFRAVSPATIAYVQAGAIVAGHVAGVVMAHDRALVVFGGGDATRSQYPLLVTMVLFTVGGLALLLGA